MSIDKKFNQPISRRKLIKGTLYGLLGAGLYWLAKDTTYAESPHIPVELKGEISDYFNGEIYSKDEFHKVEHRWDFNEALSKKTGDLKYVFDDTTELYDMLGKHIENLQDKVAGVVYDSNNKKEFAVLVDINNQRYACFKRYEEFEQPMLNTLKKYDDDIVH